VTLQAVSVTHILHQKAVRICILDEWSTFPISPILDWTVHWPQRRSTPNSKRDYAYIIFTALHGMRARYSDGNSVCPSVRPSVCQTRALWQNGRKLFRFLYHTKEHLS